VSSVAEAPTLSAAEHATLAHLRRQYTGGVKKKRGWTLAAMQQEYALFNRLAGIRKHCLNGRREWPEDERMLTEFYWLIKDERDKVERLVKADCPIGWFKPSYEQAQFLNAWHPDFDPEAPQGYQSIMDFSSVRVGKTTSMMINQFLWMIPNDPAWLVYEPYVDHLGREVRVFPRFKWDEWKRSGRRVMDPSEPPKSPCVSWFAVVDENHFNTKIEPNWRKWMPDKFIARKGKDRVWMKADKYFHTSSGHALYAKLYNSEMSAWSGEELFIASFDEGPPADKIDEVVMRSQYIYMAYTPREAANLGDRAALAFRIYKGDDESKGGKPLVGKKKFFFSKMSDAPDWIISKEKKDQRLLTASKMGEAGRVAVEGGFFTSSPLVFSNFEREMNVLPWTGAEIRRRFPTGVLLRTYDQGMAAPSACIWTLITPDNEYIFFQEWQEAQLSVGQRCEKIISLSGNKRELVKWHEDEQLRRYKEIQEGMKIKVTLADSKMFMRNQERPDQDWTETYRKNGLALEKASNIPPKARCDLMNEFFRADPSRKHILHKDERYAHLPAAQGEGTKLYVSIDCEYTIRRIGEYLWQQFSTGPRIGEFSEKPEEKDDHLLDCCGYACASNIRWIDRERILAQQPIMHLHPSPITGYA